MYRFCLAGIALPWILGAQALPDGVYRPGGDVVPAFVLAKPAPMYTEEARLARLEGSVLLAVVVGKEGQPRDVRMERPLGLGLDESAIENVRGWRFKPGSKGGQAVAVALNAEVFFRQPRKLEDWHLEGAAFALPDGVARPAVLKASFPGSGESEESVAVRASFEVGIDGLARRVRIEKSSDRSAEAGIVSALAGWRFRPAVKDGKPVAVRAWLDFVRGSHSPILLGKPGGR